MLTTSAAGETRHYISGLFSVQSLQNLCSSARFTCGPLSKLRQNQNGEMVLLNASYFVLQ